jgi:hypothetical protein
MDLQVLREPSRRFPNNKESNRQSKLLCVLQNGLFQRFGLKDDVFAYMVWLGFGCFVLRIVFLG